MSSKEEIQEDSFSSDADFTENEEDESSTDVDAKLEEDDVFDVEFFKCYSALKKKDEKIYDEKVKFFTERDESNSEDEREPANEGESGIDTKSKATNAPKMTLLDHQLSLNPDEIEEPQLNGPIKVDLNKPISKSFYDKELEEIKKSIEKVSENIQSDSDDDLLVAKDGGFIKSKPRKAISTILDKLEGEDDEDITHLKQVWSDPNNLTKEERYLRDYILNKRYLPSKAEEGDGEEEGFFSKNIDELSDNESGEVGTSKPRSSAPAHHSEEKDFDQILRIPRNSTKTIRDLKEKREKNEKRLKKVEKEKKKKKSLKDADCEDLVGDMPTKFHYRETEANDYGLSAEELLMATDEELDKWISLKDTIAYKSRDEELALKKKYDAKRNDLELKKKIFKSIYGDPDEVSNEEPQVADSKSKKKRKRNNDSESSIKELADSKAQSESKTNQEDDPSKESNRKKKKRKRGMNHKKFAKAGVAPDRLLAYGLSKTRLKKSKLL